MRGDTSDRVVDPPRAADLLAAADLIAAADAAATVVDVQRLVAALARVPGVRAAELATVAAPAQQFDLRLPVGIRSWSLELRFSAAEDEAYESIEPVCRAVAAAADRALGLGCLPSGNAGPNAPGAIRDALYSAVVASSRALIVLVDPAGSWTVLSDAFREVLGYDRFAPPGGRLIDLVHPDDHAAAVATFVEACAGRHPAGSVDLRVCAADGQWHVLEVAARSFVDDPEVGVVAYFAVDVTADREADLARERLAAVVESVPDGMVLVDPLGRLELVNPASRRLLDLGEAGLQGAPLDAVPGAGDVLDGWRDWDQLLSVLRGTLRGGGSTAVARLRDAVAEGRTLLEEEIEFEAGRVLHVDVVPVAYAGRGLGTLVHLRDVTARVATRRGLHQRCQALEERNRSLAEATALNNEFVATVAHELRGPLSSVVAFSHLLGDAASGGLTDDQRTYLDVIDRNANRLLRLIEDLLLLSRLEARTLQLRPTTVDVPDLLAAAVAERTPAATASGISLRCETVAGPELTCDDTRIHQVIDNLIGNALKFTPNGGQVTVRARPIADTWKIEVADSGIGIPAEDLPKLFRAFFRGGSQPSSPARQAAPGTGLGLVVSRAIVELHGGTIRVESSEGVGTTVMLSLPTRPLKKDGGGP